MLSARRRKLLNVALPACLLSLAVGLAFAEASDDYSRLYVYTNPPDAQVRILNIGPCYTPGMKLKPENYQIEISKSGYKTETEWVTMPQGEDLEVKISISEIEVTSPEVVTLPEPVMVTDRYGIVMLKIPAGNITMSTVAEGSGGKSAGEVQIDSFYMGKHEVTQAQWRQVMGSDPPLLRFKDCDDCPVERVAWSEVQAFTSKINELTGKKYRLPTEAEWEYACRAGSSTEYCFGDDEMRLDEYAWYSANSDNMTHPVGQKKPNAWDLHDMHGNVWEWCQDRHSTLSDKTPNGPAGSQTGAYMVRRGGSWSNAAQYCGSANSDRRPRDYRNFNLGFRLASSGD